MPTIPNRSSRLQLDAPIDRWDEAIPLGNGQIGALFWGERHSLKLSLDRADLWDLRTPEPFLSSDFSWKTLRKLVAAGDQQRIKEIFELPGETVAWPTKIPGGRLALTLSSGNRVRGFELDLRRAVGRAILTRGSVEVICCSNEPVGIVRVKGTDAKVKIVPAAFDHPPEKSKKLTGDTHLLSLSRLGYQPPEFGGDGAVAWTRQRAAEGFSYVIAVAWRRFKGATNIAFTIATSTDAQDPLELAIERVRSALDRGFNQLLRKHAEWWKTFWSASSISVPDLAVERHYYLVNYFYGSASRRGNPPIALQGLWTADEGMLPPWRGDYHNNLNTQLTYWPYLPAGRYEEGQCFLDFLWNLMPQFRRFARRFYDKPGVAIPGVIALDGQIIAGWSQYNVGPANGAWIAHHFYRHWQYTKDDRFLADRAYPFCSEVGQFLESLMECDPETDMLKLPLSSSPEIYDNTLKAWTTPNSNYDLALMRWLFQSLAEMADLLGMNDESRQWRDVLSRLDPLAVDDQLDFAQGPGIGPLLVAPGQRLTESHRHFSHMMSVHPLGTLNVEGSDRDRQIIDQTLRQILRLGTGLWCGYSFAWMACIAARCGRAWMAQHMIGCYLKASILRNGFHINGDPKSIGVSWFDYRPFTLEGNFAAAEAIHEMLLQSWGGVLRIFPAVPLDWKDVSFENLHAEGACRISATRKNGRTAFLRIMSDCGGRIVIRDPFDGETAIWNQRIERNEKNDYVFMLKPGQNLTARLG